MPLGKLDAPSEFNVKKRAYARGMVARAKEKVKFGSSSFRVSCARCRYLYQQMSVALYSHLPVDEGVDRFANYGFLTRYK
jgi:hypothetical protein